MHNSSPDTHAPCRALFGGRDRFYTDLADGLHAMAQPLTVLRSAMEVLNMPHGGAIDHRRYLSISAAQVERTCTLLACLQDLVVARVEAAARSTFDLWDLLAPIVEDRRAPLKASGIGIVAVKHTPWEPVCGDAERTEQTLSAVLRVAASLSSPGDVIELLASRPEGFVELIVQNARRHGKALNSTDRLSLSVAEVNILSQQGVWQFAEDPFRVSLAVPVQHPRPAESEVPFAVQNYHQLH